MSVLDITQDDNVTVRVGDKLKGRVAFVTGGTRGIGAGICRSLASQGAVLAAGYAGNDKAARALSRCLHLHVRTAVSIHKGNVSEPDDCRRTIDEVITSTGDSTSSSTMPASPSTRPCSRCPTTTGSRC